MAWNKTKTCRFKGACFFNGEGTLVREKEPYQQDFAAGQRIVLLRCLVFGRERVEDYPGQQGWVLFWGQKGTGDG